MSHCQVDHCNINQEIVLRHVRLHPDRRVSVNIPRRHFLDLQGKHALCCIVSATTTGHNRVRDTIAMGLAMADAGTVTEPLESQAGGHLDAGEHGFLACDVGIASPKAG